MIEIGVGIVVSIAYLFCGIATAAYASFTHEKHGRINGKRCDDCGWPLLGFIWPLYFAWRVCGKCFTWPWHLTMKQLENRRIPKATALLKKENA